MRRPIGRHGDRLDRGPARDAARPADARQGGQGGPRPAAEARRAELRAEVGRLPLPGLQGRRRGGAGQPQHQAADPLLPRGRRRDARAAARRGACSTASCSWRPGDRLEFEVLQERIHPAASRIEMLGREDPRRRSWPSTCSPSATSRTSTGRSPSAAPPWRRRSAGLDAAPCYLTRTTRTRRRPSGGSTSSRVPGSTAWSPSRWARRTVERPHDAQDQARAHRRRRRRRLPRAQDQHARAPLLGSLLLGLYARRQAPAHRRQRQLHRGAGAPS